MATRRENIRKYIEVIIEQLPRYFQMYSPEDQIFLNLFLEPLSHYREADKKRENLAKRLHNAHQQFIQTEVYLKHPFSWFAVTYFENAEVALQISSFHADDFFDYILPILRGTAGGDDGVFQLIRKITPLDDLKWERLQYLCSKLRVPLSISQVQLLNGIYTLIEQNPCNIIRPRRLRSILLEQDRTPKLSSELTRLFNILNAYWTVWPYYPAFGLKSLFLQCKLDSKHGLDKIIDFQDSKNHILQTSHVSSIRNSVNEYIGIIIIPDKQQQALQNYLERKMSEGLIKSFSLDTIIENRWVYSLTQYQTESGWEEVSKTQWDQIVRILQLDNIPRRRKVANLSYITPKAKNKWKFLQLKDPVEAINLICKNNLFTYDDLVSKTYLPDDFPLLKKLFEEEVLYLDFIATRLRDEYSLDIYYIQTPRISLYQLKKFLELVHNARVAFTENNCYIRTHLSNYMAQRITRDLNWTIYPLLPAHNITQRNINMFDKKSVSWRIPRILSN